MILDKGFAKVQYYMELSVENFTKITDKDMEVEYTLYDRLAAHDLIVAVDYDGHFGPFIFVSMMWDDMRKANVMAGTVLEQAGKIIEQYVETSP
ncbi:MAG: hypothetical protein GQ553_03970 [Nitrosomonadaceae bacterium]|nr:hypothetical protein [Nitrosomonadaceae bacterium]